MARRNGSTDNATNSIDNDFPQSPPTTGSGEGSACQRDDPPRIFSAVSPELPRPATEKAQHEPAFEAYLDPDVIWWPWWVALEYLRRKTLRTVRATSLMQIANRKHTFRTGKRAGAPSRLEPVERASFMGWVHGRAKA